MSKASEWAKRMKDADGARAEAAAAQPQWRGVNKSTVAAVNGNGELVVYTSPMPASDALDLGKWITDTFGEPNDNKESA